MAAQEQVTLVIRARDRTASAFRSIRSNIARVGRLLTRVGGAVLGATVGAAVTAAGRAEDIANRARLLGVASGNLAALARIAARADINLDELSDTLFELQVAAGEALDDPRGERARAFRRLGVTNAELRSGPIRLFRILGDRIREGNFEAERLASRLDEIGGEGLARLRPLLEDVDIFRAVAGLRLSGRTPTTEQINRLAEGRRGIRDLRGAVEDQAVRNLDEAAVKLIQGATRLEEALRLE